MIYFMLKDTGVKSWISLLFNFSFKILIFHDNSLLSFYFPLFSRDGEAGFFRDLFFFGAVNDFWIDEQGFSEKVFFCRFSAWHFFSLRGCDHGEVFPNLWCGESYTVVFSHQFHQNRCKFLNFSGDFCNFFSSSS